MPDETPVVEKTTQTAGITETTKATTEAAAAAVISPPPAVVADDAIRTQIAWAIIGSDTITCAIIVWLLFKFGNGLSKDIITIVATMAGSIIGYRARDTGTVINYLFGSSSDSTAKSAMLGKK
jgi:hypothetical protein